MVPCRLGVMLGLMGTLVVGLSAPAGALGSNGDRSVASPAAEIDQRPTIPIAWRNKLNDLQKRVDAALQQQDFAGVQAAWPGVLAEAQSWFDKVKQTTRVPIKLVLEPGVAWKGGIIAHVALRSDRVRDGGIALYDFGDVWLVGDGPQISQTPWEASNRNELTQLDAVVTLTPVKARIAVDAIATIRPHGETVVPVALCVVNQPGLVLKPVTANGAACPVRRYGGMLFVSLPKVTDEVKLRFRYEGVWHGGNHWDYVRPDQVVLRQESNWLPKLSGPRTRFEITVRHPRDFALFGQGEQSTAVALAPQLSQSHWRYRGDGESSFALYGGLGYRQWHGTRQGIGLTLAAAPWNDHRLASISRLADTILKRYAVIGPYPFSQLRIVETDFSGGYGALSNITLNSFDDDAGLSSFLAHELAHGYFSGAVPFDRTTDEATWTEGLAEYLSSWCLDPAGQADKRAKWSRSYAGVAPAADRPVVNAPDGPWKLRSAILYSKAALVYAALADRVGSAAMERALKAFVDERRERSSRWQDLFRSLEGTLGKAEADWVRIWLTRAGAPDLRLAGTLVNEGILSGHLVQTIEPPFAGVVELGIEGSDGVVKVEKVPFAAPDTPFRFQLPPGTKRVVLDPGYRLPRLYDPKADPTDAGLVVELK